MQCLPIEPTSTMTSEERAYEISQALYKFSTATLETSNTSSFAFSIITLADGRSALACEPTSTVNILRKSIAYIEAMLQIMLPHLTSLQISGIATSLASQDSIAMAEIAALDGGEFVEIPNTMEAP
jgi:hypothetical protein